MNSISSKSASFDDTLRATGLFPLTSKTLKTLQVNVGYRCNQACTHCHVGASPVRREVMDRLVMEACIELAKNSSIETVDITGGAPEMHPDFSWFVERLSELKVKIKTRTNLTILLDEGFEELPDFLASKKVEVIASLPCYQEGNVDSQRGSGSFLSSIAALKRLNAVGYGLDGTGLTLNLVYNPLGSTLPPSQDGLQEDYRRELRARYNLSFTNLFVIANMPIGRFRESLVDSGELDTYIGRLSAAFNPMAAVNAMCREMISVGYDGSIFDCDFNQVLGLRCGDGATANIKDLDIERLAARRIVTGPHCYGCTAGAGSSCGGEVANG
jgi:radical SAM/Cys-rich protein